MKIIAKLSKTPKLSIFFCAIAALLTTHLNAQQTNSQTPNQPNLGAIYAQQCEGCHSGGGQASGLHRAIIDRMSAKALAERIDSVEAHENLSLNTNERDQLVEHITRQPVKETIFPSSAYCQSASSEGLKNAVVHWSSFGGDNHNLAYRNHASAGLNAADMSDLKLKWAFAVPHTGRSRSQAAVIGNRMLIGTARGDVFSLDINSGCIHWKITVTGAVRGGITIEEGEEPKAYFADWRANVYSVLVETGEILWKKEVEDRSSYTITGTPALFEDHLYVPLSTTETFAVFSPEYECCKSSGRVIAVNKETGETTWKFDTITEEPSPQGKNELGVTIWGPSGAAVWSSPAIDAKRRLIYVGTGQNYTWPANETSDAILAINLDSGELVWSYQGYNDDVWNPGCMFGNANCPKNAGPDVDFTTPILVTAHNGKEMIIAGQKSGAVHALDPDKNGELIWMKQVGRGGSLGGVHWGVTSDGSQVYVPMSDRIMPGRLEPLPGEPKPGMFALDILTGEINWQVLGSAEGCGDGKSQCLGGLSAAPLSVDGAVIAGDLEGVLRIYDSKDGNILWQMDTYKEFETVNGIKGHGGSFDGSGPIAVNGMIITGSGYDILGQKAGNLIMAFAK